MVNKGLVESRTLNRLLGRLMHVHGYFCMGDEMHYGMLISFEFRNGRPFGTFNLFPQYHACVMLENVPIFNNREEAMRDKAPITAWKRPTNVGRKRKEQ